MKKVIILIFGGLHLFACSKSVDSIITPPTSSTPSTPVTTTPPVVTPVTTYIESHTELNQKTGWYQTNKLFAGYFFIDSTQNRNLYKNADGSLKLASWQGTGAGYFSNRTCLYYGDINGDGKKDIINNYWATPFGANIPGYYVTWEYEKSGFTTPHITEGLTGARKFIFNDYFNTGKLQALVASSGADASPFPGDIIQMISFNSDMTMSLKNITDVIGYYHTGASGDIDNDGDIDFLLYSGGGQSKMGFVYFENIGSNTFKYNPNLVTGINYINNNPNNYYTIELFDVNKDGNLDIIMGGSNMSQNPSRILWGSSAHTFNTNNQTLLPANTSYSSVMDIAFSDIDKDGDIDIFLLSEINYQGFGIQILENQNNSFVDVTSTRVDVSNKPNSLWFAWLRLNDIDNDGDYDLVADGCGYLKNQVGPDNQPVPRIIWLNDGKGNYKSSFYF